MFFFSGVGTYGAVERAGRAYIATRFQSLQFLPIFPRGSFLFMEDESGAVKWILPVKLSARSVICGYLRSWGLVSGFVAALSGYAHLRQTACGPLELGAVLGSWVLLVALAFGIGVLTPAERAQRRVYEAFAGAPVDVAQLAELAADRVTALRAEVVEAARSFAAKGYRTAADPERAWASILAGAEVSDVNAVRAALTLARLDWAAARGAERQALGLLHEKLWERLVALDPAVSEAT